MDLATLIGLLAGIVIVLIGIVLALPDISQFFIFINPPSALLVFGGGFAAVFINFPMGDLKEAFKVMIHVFRFKVASATDLIEKMRGYAEIARRDGILALESVSEEGDDPFLIKGVQLAVDGTDPELIKDMMETELDNLRERHERGQAIFQALTTFSPAWGMIGTLIGLIAMLANLDDPSKLGQGMAVALITTLYGAVAANLVFGPFTEKLKIRSAQEIQVKEMIIRGVIAIQSGDNPRVVEQKLVIYLRPAQAAQYTTE
jgi:chemotaxis protein MotA